MRAAVTFVGCTTEVALEDVDDSTVFGEFVDVEVWIVTNVFDLLVVVLVNLVVTYGGGTGQSFPHPEMQRKSK